MESIIKISLEIKKEDGTISVPVFNFSVDFSHHIPGYLRVRMIPEFQQELKSLMMKFDITHLTGNLKQVEPWNGENKGT